MGNIKRIRSSIPIHTMYSNDSPLTISRTRSSSAPLALQYAMAQVVNRARTTGSANTPVSVPPFVLPSLLLSLLSSTQDVALVQAIGLCSGRELLRMGWLNELRVTQRKVFSPVSSNPNHRCSGTLQRSMRAQYHQQESVPDNTGLFGWIDAS